MSKKLPLYLLKISCIGLASFSIYAQDNSPQTPTPTCTEVYNLCKQNFCDKIIDPTKNQTCLEGCTTTQTQQKALGHCKD